MKHNPEDASRTHDAIDPEAYYYTLEILYTIARRSCHEMYTKLR